MEVFKCPTCYLFSSDDTVASCYFCNELLVINETATCIRKKWKDCRFGKECIGCYSNDCYNRIKFGFCTSSNCHLNSPFNLGKIFKDYDDVFCCVSCILFILENGLCPENYLEGITYEDTPYNFMDYNLYYYELKRACEYAVMKPEWNYYVSLQSFIRDLT